MSTIISKEVFTKNIEDIKQALYSKKQYLKKVNNGFSIPLSVAHDLDLVELKPVKFNPPDIQLRDYQLPLVNKMKDLYEEIPAFTLNADTGSGKTFMALYYAIAMEVPFLVMMHRGILVNQWYTQLVNMNVIDEDDIFACRSLKRLGDYDGENIVITCDWIVNEMPMNLLKKFKFIIYDETHESYTDTALEALLNCTGAHRVLGCTATMKDEIMGSNNFKMSKFFSTNKIRFEKPIKYEFHMINSGVCLLNYNQYNIDMPLELYTSMTKAYAQEPLALKRWVKSLLIVVGTAISKTVVICDRVDKCMYIADLINRYAAKIGMELHDKAQNYADTYVEDDTVFDGYSNFIVGTSQKLLTGFDIYNATDGNTNMCVNNIVIAFSIRDQSTIWQALGRGTRYEGVVKLIWLYHDIRIYHLHRNLAAAYLNSKKSKPLSITCHDHHEKVNI